MSGGFPGMGGPGGMLGGIGVGGGAGAGYGGATTLPAGALKRPTSTDNLD